MKSRRLIVLLSFLVLGLTTFSYADREGINERVKQAHMQIERGIKSGSLTREEAHRLKKELDTVLDDESRMKADGKLTHHERERLEKELDRLEKHISNLKTNDNRRDNDDGRDHKRY